MGLLFFIAVLRPVWKGEREKGGEKEEILKKKEDNISLSDPKILF